MTAGRGSWRTTVGAVVVVGICAITALGQDRQTDRGDNATQQSQQTERDARQTARDVQPSERQSPPTERRSEQTERRSRQSEQESRQAERQSPQTEQESRRTERTRFDAGGASTEQAEGSKRISLNVPSGESVVGISVVMPRQVRVREQFQYQIQVKNLSDSLMLRDVKLQQENAQAFFIEKAEISTSDGDWQELDVNRGSRSRQTASASEQRSSSARDDQSQREQRHRGTWTISQLNPGESRTIRVTAASDQQGRSPMCLAVTSYMPAVCVATEFVDVEVNLTKRAPRQASLCEIIELEYYIENRGEADLGRFVVRDTLPENMQTTEGNDNLEFVVDGLRAGDTRKFVGRVVAQQPGNFSSRAQLLQNNKPLTRSSNTTTAVEAPELAVAIDGPRDGYIDRPMTFTARVTNRGNVASPDTRLVIHYPDHVRLTNMGRPRQVEQAVEQAPNQNQRSGADQPTPATRQANASQEERREESRRQRDPQTASMDAEAIRLGSLEPGQTRAVSFTVLPDQPGSIDLRAVGSYVCQTSDAGRVEAVATTEAEVIAQSALLLAVVDAKDPVRVDDEVVYSIVVANQGDAPDHNVRVTAELPEGLEFVELVDGPTDAQVDGNQITFEPVEVIQPKRKAQWNVRTRAVDRGEVLFKVNLESDGLETSPSSEEPTQLF